MLNKKIFYWLIGIILFIFIYVLVLRISSVFIVMRSYYKLQTIESVMSVSAFYFHSSKLQTVFGLVISQLNH